MRAKKVLQNQIAISVLMPVYNGEKFLAEAMESILNQTFRDFEFIIIDDGSTDGTAAILAEYANKDNRIRLIENETNCGIAQSLNKGIAATRGAYIARMDADDVSLTHRLQMQYEFMETHPAVTVSGSFLETYETHEQWSVPIADNEIRVAMLFNSPLFHPTIIMRSGVILEKEAWYDTHLDCAQDYSLWAYLSRHAEIVFANIPSVLVQYRTHITGERSQYKRHQKQIADHLRRNLLSRLGVHPSEDEFACHEIYYRGGLATDIRQLRHCGCWLEKIYRYNKMAQIYDDSALNAILLEHWRNLCWRSASSGVMPAILYLSSSLVPKTRYALREAWGMMRYSLRARSLA